MHQLGSGSVEQAKSQVEVWEKESWGEYSSWRNPAEVRHYGSHDEIIGHHDH